MNSIKMNAQSVRDTLDGQKTMFREPTDEIPMSYLEYCENNSNGDYASWLLTKSPMALAKYKVGEVLKVIEVKAITCSDSSEPELMEFDTDAKIRITGRKLEYLQDISEEDCIKEGVIKEKYPPHPYNFMYNNVGTGGSINAWLDATNAFKHDIWKPLNYPPKYQWKANPPVIAYEYEVVS